MQLSLFSLPESCNSMLRGFLKALVSWNIQSISIYKRKEKFSWYMIFLAIPIDKISSEGLKLLSVF